jgi:hypothetical protein
MGIPGFGAERSLRQTTLRHASVRRSARLNERSSVIPAAAGRKVTVRVDDMEMDTFGMWEFGGGGGGGIGIGRSGSASGGDTGGAWGDCILDPWARDDCLKQTCAGLRGKELAQCRKEYKRMCEDSTLHCP